MAGMAAAGGAAIMLISHRKLKKEGKNLQQTGIDPTQLTGVQTSASSGGYQTVRGEAQVTGLEDYNEHKSYYDEKSHKWKKSLKTNHQVSVVHCQKVSSQKNK